MDICLKGSNGAEKIILRVYEIGKYPDEDGFPLSYEIIVDSSWCHVSGYQHFSWSSVLRGFRDALQNCYGTLTGSATYGDPFEWDFRFTVQMTSLGHAVVSGELSDTLGENVLKFTMETEQSYFAETLSAINKLEKQLKAMNQNHAEKDVE